MSDIQSYGANPGSGAVNQSSEVAVWTGREQRNEYGTMQIKSTAVDAGNTPTTYLRAGLVLGKITATGLLKEYAPTSTDGSQIAYCVLAQGLSMLDNVGVAAQRQGHVLLKGILQAASLTLLDNMARKQLLLSGRYLFDDAISSPLGSSLHYSEVSKGADYTVVAADAGTLFTAITGAVTFTLPAIAPGLGPFEFLNTVDAAMAVTGAAANLIVTDGNATASTITFSTSSHKIGGRVRFRANAAGTKWYMENLSPAACVITVS